MYYVRIMSSMSAAPARSSACELLAGTKRRRRSLGWLLAGVYSKLAGLYSAGAGRPLEFQESSKRTMTGRILQNVAPSRFQAASGE